MGEHSITQAKASVMLYDNERKQWQHSGGAPGLSRVNIYFHPVNNTFRIVGRKLDDHAVVINCALARGLKYNEATPTFHQWRDQRQVYGLNFQSSEDAINFGQEVRRALETLKEATVTPQPAQSFQQRDQFYQESVSNGPQQDDTQMRQQRYADYDSHDNYSSRTRVPTAGAQDRQQYNRQYESQISGGGSESESPSSSQLSVASSLPPASPVQSSAPPAPTPPPAPPVAPPAPAAPPAPPAPAPPQPPPVPGIGGPPAPPPPPPAPPAPSSGGGGGSLAEQIAAAKLKKASASKGDSSDGGAIRTERAGSTARSNNVGGMDMMAEMQRKLAARRAKSEDKPADKPVSNGPVREEERSFPIVRSTSSVTTTSSSPTPPFSSSKTNFGNPPPSQPKLTRSESRFNSSSSKSDVTLTSDQLEEFKTELLMSFRQELQNYKEEIIEAVRQEVSKIM